MGDGSGKWMAATFRSVIPPVGYTFGVLAFLRSRVSTCFSYAALTEMNGSSCVVVVGGGGGGASTFFITR